MNANSKKREVWRHKGFFRPLLLLLRRRRRLWRQRRRHRHRRWRHRTNGAQRDRRQLERGTIKEGRPCGSTDQSNEDQPASELLSPGFISLQVRFAKLFLETASWSFISFKVDSNSDPSFTSRTLWPPSPMRRHSSRLQSFREKSYHRPA